jgi:hypothetical protein
MVGREVRRHSSRFSSRMLHFRRVVFRDRHRAVQRQPAEAIASNDSPRLMVPGDFFMKCRIASNSFVTLSAIGLGVILTGPPARAQGATVAAPLTLAPKLPAAKRLPSTGIKSGNIDNGWVFTRRKDNFSDKQTCMISRVDKPYVEVTKGHLNISYSGRGGVRSFKYRLDDGPASATEIPHEIDQRIGVVHVYGPTFAEVLRSNRFRLQTLTLVNGISEEDFNTSGMIRLYASMISQCP